MKYYFAILFFGLLQAGGSQYAGPQYVEPQYLGSNYIADECPSGELVDVNVVNNIFQEAAVEFRTAILEYGDRSGSLYKEMFADAIVYYGEQLHSRLYSEARDQIDRLVRDIQRAESIIIESIQSASNYNRESTFCDEALEQLINHLEAYLALQPGTINFRRAELPSLPENPLRPRNRTTSRTLTEIFLGHQQILNEYAEQILAFSFDIYLNSWSNARTGYPESQMQFYNELLLGRLLRAARQAVNTVNQHSDWIERNVSPGTWLSFGFAARRINAISVDCRPPPPRYEAENCA